MNFEESRTDLEYAVHKIRYRIKTLEDELEEAEVSNPQEIEDELVEMRETLAKIETELKTIKKSDNRMFIIAVVLMFLAFGYHSFYTLVYGPADITKDMFNL
ncbi:hypothetical protein M8J75_000127 [Diaphorina citri]|nr:hypothetical protein M8J75_000127 [Diaphorina citri]